MPENRIYGSLYDKVAVYGIRVSCREPLHIGSGDSRYGEVLIHPIEGRPFVPAAGIAGAFREYYSCDKALQTKLFGCAGQDEDENNSSRLRFYDGLFEHATVYTELRPRLKIDGRTGTCRSNLTKGSQIASGQKFEMESIAAGAEFTFRVYLYEKENQDRQGEAQDRQGEVQGRQDEAQNRQEKDLEQSFEEALKALNSGRIQLGGQKSNGCGYVTIISAEKTCYVMTNPEDLAMWPGEEKQPSDITQSLKDSTGISDHRIHFELTGETEGSILVKAVSVREYGENAPDSVNICNHRQQYLIPASSLKGVIRSQIEKIADYRGMDDQAVTDIFGAAADDEGAGSAGKIRFYDCEIGSGQANVQVSPQKRIHIDKFTGGVMYQHLFSERPVFGKMTIRADLESLPEQEERNTALVLLALRDLGMGLLSMGSGSNIGRGYLRGRSLKVWKEDKVLVEIDLQAGKVIQGNDTAMKYLQALSCGEGRHRG